MPTHTWTLTTRQLSDLELLLNGGFAPLNGFMNRADYDSVVKHMRLATGQLWPMPITLDLPETFALGLHQGEELHLKVASGEEIATLLVEDVWRPDRALEAEKVYGTSHIEHPAVRYLFDHTHAYYVGGRLQAVTPYKHFAYPEYFAAPAILRHRFKALEAKTVAAFHTRNPLHRGHLALCQYALEQGVDHVLIHPATASLQTDDIDFYTRMRCYLAAVEAIKEPRVSLALCPLTMRMAGPREAVWHAIIRKNYGCTHLIVGRHHATPTSSNPNGDTFYGEYEAQELLKAHVEEIGIKLIAAHKFVYAPDENRFIQVNALKPGQKIEDLSGTRVRQILQAGGKIPDWFTYPAVQDELRYRYPSGSGRGFALFLTGTDHQTNALIARGVEEVLLQQIRQGVTCISGQMLSQYFTTSACGGCNAFCFCISEIIKAHGTVISFNLDPSQWYLLNCMPREVWHSCLMVTLSKVDKQVTEGHEAGETRTLNFLGRSTTIDPSDPDDAVRQIVKFIEMEGFLSEVGRIN